MTGVKAKDVTAKLGKPDSLRSVADTKTHIASVIAPKLKELIAVADAARSRALVPINKRRLAMKAQHATERQRLDDGQKARSSAEAKQRAERLRGGVMGLWDRVTGQHGRVSKENEAEAFAAFKRDRAQRNELVADQLKERRSLQREIIALRHRHIARVLELHCDLVRQIPDHDRRRDSLRHRFRDAGSPSRSKRSSRQSRGKDNHRSPRGPELGR